MFQALNSVFNCLRRNIHHSRTSAEGTAAEKEFHYEEILG
jgi:hypothetical protein